LCNSNANDQSNCCAHKDQLYFQSSRTSFPFIEEYCWQHQVVSMEGFINTAKGVSYSR
jgi:hypothetical protein